MVRAPSQDQRWEVLKDLQQKGRYGPRGLMWGFSNWLYKVHRLLPRNGLRDRTWLSVHAVDFHQSFQKARVQYGLRVWLKRGTVTVKGQGNGEQKNGSAKQDQPRGKRGNNKKAP